MWYIVLHITTQQEALATRLVRLNSVKSCVKKVSLLKFYTLSVIECTRKAPKRTSIAKNHFQTNCAGGIEVVYACVHRLLVSASQKFVNTVSHKLLGNFTKFTMLCFCTAKISELMGCQLFRNIDVGLLSRCKLCLASVLCLSWTCCLRDCLYLETNFLTISLVISH